jgi:hypothetical protein
MGNIADAALVQRVSIIIEPKAYLGTADEIHRACSPNAVEYMRDRANAKAGEIINSLRALGADI